MIFLSAVMLGYGADATRLGSDLRNGSAPTHDSSPKQHLGGEQSLFVLDGISRRREPETEVFQVQNLVLPATPGRSAAGEFAVTKDFLSLNNAPSTPPLPAVPEPATATAFLGLGMGMMWIRRRLRKSS